MNELGPSNGFTFGQNNRYDADLQWPTSTEYSVEFQRQLPGNLVASVGYTHRLTRNNIAPRNVAVPTDTYIPLTVTEVNSGRQVTVYNQAPALRGKSDILWANAPELDTSFNGGDFTVNKRMSNHWSVTGGASFGKTLGDIYPTTSAATADLNNPNFAYPARALRQRRAVFVPRVRRLRVSLPDFGQCDRRSTTSGFPELTTVSVGNNTVVLTQGATSLTVEPRGTTRLPPVASLDVSVRKNMVFGGMKVEPRIDFFNLTNEATILGRVTQLGPTYDRVSSIQRGRLIKVGASIEF